jgi:hypothetical protein
LLRKKIFCVYIDFFSLCKYYFDLYVETTLLRQSKNLYKLI